MSFITVYGKTLQKDKILNVQFETLTSCHGGHHQYSETQGMKYNQTEQI